MFIIEGNPNTPLESCARYAEVFKPGLYEIIHHFVYAGGRLEEICFGQQLFDSLCKRLHFHEISFLLSINDIAPAFGAFAVLEL
jgi:protein-S-isoprenylcysteine O-methyltransferase Ste14